MSLISDTDFLIHSLRLSYLRDVDDPYGSRIISFNPSYTSNPYILSASLADADRYPELSMPSSPHLSEEEGEQPARMQGARLNYTRTIMGRRSGGLGLRVHGKRASTSKRMSVTPDAQNFLPQKAAVEALAPVNVEEVPDSWVKIADPAEKPNVQIQEPTVQVEEAPVTKAVQFVPKFKMAAEMEARRRLRMAARRGAPAPPPPPIDSSSSSSSDEEIPIVVDATDSDSDSDFSAAESDASVESFDSDFRTPILPSSPSDLTSEPSTGIPSLPDTAIQRPRLSPVTEHRISDNDEPAQLDPSIFEIVNPAPARKRPNNGEKYYPPRRLSGATMPRLPHRRAEAPPLPTVPTNSSSTSPEISFPRKKVVPAKPQKSALTAMLLSSSTSNPFADIYGSVSGRAEAQSTSVMVYFPHATSPRGKPMNLKIRKDATIEEVLGFALFTYWEEGWEPKLDEGLSGENDPKWVTRMSGVGWVMKIAEDDGEVDDDFPPPDRQQNIVKVNADAYAILEATPTQIAQNQLSESKMPRIITTKKSSSTLALPVPTIGPSVSAEFGSALGSVPLSTSLGPSFSHGPTIYLKIRIAEAADSVLYTTVSATTGMYMQEVLESVCRRRKLANPKDYVLVIQAGETSILVPLDRTVASIQDKRELILLKRSMLPQYGPKGPGKTTDPNASIFKRMSEAPPEVKMSAALDFTAAYKKYTIYRKMPMRVARQELTLAIDGVYIHIMPSKGARAVFDSGKTSSYHAKAIVDCQQTSKSSSAFRIILGKRNKSYDYEAETPKKAAEIVAAVKGLKTLERSSTVKHSRSSRHAG